jgi:hypothetical protein
VVVFVVVVFRVMVHLLLLYVPPAAKQEPLLANGLVALTGVVAEGVLVTSCSVTVVTLTTGVVVVVSTLVVMASGAVVTVVEFDCPGVSFEIVHLLLLKLPPALVHEELVKGLPP